MYQYTDFDRQFIRLRAAQYRDQLERHLNGKLSDEEFLPLRLQNGWYVQRHAPMLRVAIPYGDLTSKKLRGFAKIARELDKGYLHITTRQNVQYNWIPLDKSADALDMLADIDMHGIQTSGNCIRNVTSDELAGIAQDEVADPRPYCEILRQWSTLHPEFAFLPRKFKFAVTGAAEDRAAVRWHDIGLYVVKNDAGEIGFQVMVGGGMGRTPIIAPVIRDFVPWYDIINYCEACIRVYNRYGRRDNKYKARIKILVKAEGQKYIDAVEEEFRRIIEDDGAPHRITQAELDRVSAHFAPPDLGAALAHNSSEADLDENEQKQFARWKARNIAAHKNPELAAVTLVVKRIGQAPGDLTDEQLEQVADLAEAFSAGHIRATHDQNMLLPWVRKTDLVALWRAAKAIGLANPTHHLFTDMIACPGGDFCALANARSLPIAAELFERYQDLDVLEDLGEIDLHISGCINSCGHHHSGHIGILGVDKKGEEFYQLTLGGSDGSELSGEAVAGKVLGPSVTADLVVDIIDAILVEYKSLREGDEQFIDTVKRVGIPHFKEVFKTAKEQLEVTA